MKKLKDLKTPISEARRNYLEEVWDSFKQQNLPLEDLVQIFQGDKQFISENFKAYVYFNVR